MNLLMNLYPDIAINVFKPLGFEFYNILVLCVLNSMTEYEESSILRLSQAVETRTHIAFDVI